MLIHDEKALNQPPYRTDKLDKVRSWVAQGDVVGVFENHALDSAGLGDLVFMVFDKADVPKMKLGTRAPDTPTFIGWRHQLIAVCDKPEDFAPREAAA